MSEPTMPSPLPRPEQRPQSHLLPSSILSTPSFSSTLPLPRPTTILGAAGRSSSPGKPRNRLSQPRRRTRSAASSASHSSEGSLRDFSMENYTIDLAQVGRKIGGPPMVGVRQIGEESAKEEKTPLVAKTQDKDEEEDCEDFLDEYTIDLGGLGEKPSSVVVEDRERERDEVGSEDNGPEDFTMNLEKWMKGTENWKTEQDDNEANDDCEPEGDAQVGTQATKQDAIGEESAFEPIGTSTPGPLTNHPSIEDGIREEVSLQVRPLSRMNTEMLQEKAAEDVLDRIAALQMEIERMRLEEEKRRSGYQSLERAYERMEQQHDAEKKREQSRHDALQQEHAQMKRTCEDAQGALHQENEQLRQKYDYAIKQLQALALGSQSNKTGGESQPDTLPETATNDLATLKAKAEADEKAADTRIKALKAELKACQDECSGLRAEIKSLQNAHNTEVKELNAHLEARQNEVALERKESIHRSNEAVLLSENLEQKDQDIHASNSELKAVKMQLEHAEGQLTETRRIVESVEDENDRLMQQNDRQADDIAGLRATIKDYASREQAVTASQEETQSVPSSSEPQSIDKSIHEAAPNALSQQQRATLSSLGNNHGKEVQTPCSALSKATQAIQKQEAKLTKTHENEISSLKQEIADLKRKSANPALASNTGIEHELRSAIRVLSNKLEKANASIASARAETVNARQMADDIQNSNDMVNAELEARFAETVEAREREWRRRIKLLFRERDRMGKALLWGWGREEMGVKPAKDREQAYRYRYVTR